MFEGWAGRFNGYATFLRQDHDVLPADIQNIPSLQFFVRGQLVHLHAGADFDERQLVEFLKEYSPNAREGPGQGPHGHSLHGRQGHPGQGPHGQGPHGQGPHGQGPHGYQGHPLHGQQGPSRPDHTHQGSQYSQYMAGQHNH